VPRCGTTLIRWLPVSDFCAPRRRRIGFYCWWRSPCLCSSGRCRWAEKRSAPRGHRRPGPASDVANNAEAQSLQNDKLREEIRKLRIKSDRPDALTLLVILAPSLTAPAASPPWGVSWSKQREESRRQRSADREQHEADSVRHSTRTSRP
jgi:hypothetical protein